MEEQGYKAPETIEEQLDAILLILLSEKLRRSESDHLNSGYNISAVCEALQLNIGNEKENYLATLLLNDGNLESLHENLGHIIRISRKGVGFISNGGYVQQMKDEEHRKEIERINLENTRSSISINRWNKFGIVISIFISLASLAISIIAIWASKN